MFCDAASGSCFQLHTTPRSFYEARDWCSAFAGGILLAPSSAAKQRLVEK